MQDWIFFVILQCGIKNKDVIKGVFMKKSKIDFRFYYKLQRH